LFLILLSITSYQLDAAIVPQDSIRTYSFPDSIVVIANRYQLSLQSVTNTVDILPVKVYPEVAVHSILELTDALSPQVFVMEKRVVGFGVGERGSGNVSIRGMGGRPNTGILVLINGRPDFMGIFGHPLPDVYGLGSVDQVEVIAGPSSTIFGSGAMGGVINLVTQGTGPERLNFTVRGGSYNTLIQHLDISHTFGETRSRFFLTHQKTDGHVPSSGFDGWNLAGVFQKSLSSEWSISLEGRYVPYHFNDPAMGEDLAGLGYYGKIRRGMVDVKVDGKSGRLNNSFHLYSNLGHHRFNDGFESHDFTYGLSSYQGWQYSPKLQVNFGLDALYYGGKARNTVFPQAPPRPDLNTITSLGGYLLLYYDPVTFVTVQAGLRAQYASPDLGKATPVLGLSMLPFKFVRIFANYNEGYRIPTLQELYLFPVSNPALDPEEVRSYELGSFVFLGGKNHLRFSVFQNRINNIIQLTANPAFSPPQIFLNSGSARQWGTESLLSIHFIQSADARISYSFLNPDYLTAFSPRHMVKYFASYSYSFLSLSVFGKYIADLYADNNRQDLLGDYHIINMAISVHYRHVIMDLSVRNLLDCSYEVLPGYAAPGFNIMAGFTIQWPFSQ
jgi:outer membrane cobalamin receptor